MKTNVPSRFAFLVFLVLLALPSVGQQPAQPVLRRSPDLTVAEPIRVTGNPANLHLRNLPIDIGSMANGIQELELTDLQGNDIERTLSPTLSGSTLTVDTSVVKEFVIRPRTVRTMSIVENRMMRLPGGLVIRTGAAGTAGGPTGVDVISLTCLASPVPAIWDPDDAFYTMKLMFGLETSSGSASAQELAEPVEVRLYYEGLVGSPEPSLQLTAVGLQNQKSFVLNFNPTTENPVLHVRSSISKADLSLEALPRLALSPESGEVLGLGLQSVHVRMDLLQPHGAPAALDEVIPVSVSVSGLAKTEKLIPPFQKGRSRVEFDVRSGGSGPIEITATAGILTAQATIIQRFPYGLLMGILFGGLLGGLVRWIHKSKQLNRLHYQLIEGVGTGIIVTTAGLLGIGFLDISLPEAVRATEAGGFVIAALSGYLGAKALDGLLDKGRSRP